AEADNFLFLISPNSVSSKETLNELDIAIKYKKRIIPLLINSTNDNDLPLKLRAIQYIDFTDRTEKLEVEIKDHNDIEAEVEARKTDSPLEKSVNELLIHINDNRHNYYLHKVFLAQALKWISYGKPDSMLLRAYNLENANAWLKLSENQSYRTNKWQDEFISISQAKEGTLDSEIFIIYSRSDSDFARKMNFELQAAGKTTWFDQETIASGSDFEDEINIGIEQSNNIIFLISPNSINSDYCQNEVKQALNLSKRIITLLIQETDTETIPSKLATIQWIDFYSLDYNTSFAELIRTLDTDKEHVRQHSFYAREAKRWDEAGKVNDYALRGQELEVAQTWLEEAEEEEKKPEASTLQREYIERSGELLLILLQKEKQQKRIKRLLIIVIVVGFFAFLFGGFAYTNYLQSEKQKKIALVERERAQKNEVIARKMAEEARKQALNAEEQSLIAMQQKAIAEEQTLIALVEKAEAQNARRLADSARAMADRQKRYAIKSKKKAEASEKMANIQRKKAEEAEERAHYYLYAFNAKNLASEALSINDQQIQGFLANTALELNYVADSLAAKYEIPHPYMPTITQALLVTYIQNNNTVLLNEQAKSILINENMLYYGKTVGGLAKSEINGSIEEGLSDEQVLLAPEIGNVYSLVQIHNKLYFNTSYSRVYYYFNDKANDISPFVSSNVNKLIKLPEPSQMQVKLNNGNSILFDENQFSQSIVSGRQFVVTKNMGNLIFSKLNTEVNWKSSANKYSVLDFLESNSTIFTTTGTGKIRVTNATISEEFPVGHSGQISCISISSDEKWMATGSFDGSIMIWYLGEKMGRTNTLLPMSIKPKASKYISSLVFTEDNNYLIYADNESIKFIPMDIKLIYQNTIKQSKISKAQQNKWWEYYKRGEIHRYQGNIF
ncbi:MAG: TIR domain-containing protein, partial [Bacteroidales bacterium]|nr:TIR domain-containing protein [Bacteroidales bacterium]